MSACVAVITPVYCTPQNKRLALLEETIASVQAQQGADIWHVIVDDGSDPSLNRINSENHHVVLLKDSVNKGHCSAINSGLEYAFRNVHPDFVTVLNSDDVLYPSSIADRVNACTKETPVVYSDLAVFSATTSGLLRTKQFCAKELYNRLLCVQNIPYPTLLWKTDFFKAYVKQFDEKLRDAEDWDVCLNTARGLCAEKKSAVYIEQPTVAYRLHENNLSHKNIRDGTRWKCHKRILKKHIDGPRYWYGLMNSARMIVPSFLPESIRSSLRAIRDLFGAPIKEYDDEFLRGLRGKNPNA
ncbi:MAG: glycosyltransferase [Candidatus Woesearchaeota archaeon]|nr:glycosyltransferase [Candidatus Woesearchaeota archaeon]